MKECEHPKSWRKVIEDIVQQLGYKPFYERKVCSTNASSSFVQTEWRNAESNPPTCATLGVLTDIGL